MAQLIDDEPPALDGRYMGAISSDFVKIADLLKEAAYQIKVQKISQYPVFPICRTAQSIGSLLIAAGQRDLQWNYYMSFIEEFIQRGLMPESGLEEFKSVFKDPEVFCCLFVVDEKFTNFLFIPFPEDEQAIE